MHPLLPWRRRSRVGALILAISISALPAVAVGATPKPTLFDNVTLVDTANGVLVGEMAVLVRKGKIEAIDRTGRIAAPANGRTILGNGRYLMPGLADMHVHIEDDAELAVYLANGITTLRQASGFRVDRLRRDAVAAGDLIGPQIFVASPTTDGDPPVWEDNVVVRNRAEAREIVKVYDELGYDFVKVYSNMAPAQFKTILKEGRKRGVPVIGHIPWSMPFEEILRTDLRSMEHLYGMVGTIESSSSPYLDQVTMQHVLGAVPIDEERLPELGAAVEASGIWTCSTLLAIDRWIGGEAYDRLLARRVNRYVSPIVFDWWVGEGRDFVEQTVVDVSEGDFQQGRETRRKIVAALAAAEAPLILGTDTGSWHIVAGFSIHEEIRAHLEAGLSMAEILKIATVNAASSLDRLDEFGTIEVGKRADLVLLKRNPLAKPRSLEKPLGVMVAGRWLPKAKLRKMLRQAAAQFRSQASGSD